MVGSGKAIDVPQPEAPAKKGNAAMPAALTRNSLRLIPAQPEPLDVILEVSRQISVRVIGADWKEFRTNGVAKNASIVDGLVVFRGLKIRKRGQPG